MSPDAQEFTHTPAEHTRPDAQALPQAPQWALSFCRSRHTPEHSLSPATHDTTHAPAEQT